MISIHNIIKKSLVAYFPLVLHIWQFLNEKLYLRKGIFAKLLAQFQKLECNVQTTQNACLNKQIKFKQQPNDSPYVEIWPKISLWNPFYVTLEKMKPSKT